MNILTCVLLTSLLLSPFMQCVVAAPPAIQRPMEITEATIEGGEPFTIDPAACYDTASSELLMNMYDTLVFFNGERLDRYLPQLADDWTVQNITGTASPDGLFWYFRYTFHLRPNVRFWDGSTLTPEDVEYCFEREMVLDVDGGPQWMFYEPLLNTWGALGLNATALESNSTEQARVGAIISHSVECNSTHVWFNIGFPGAYAPFMQILCQSWSSIYSKAWALSLGRPTNWDGNWSDWFSHWQSIRYPVLPPFDYPTPVAMGTGPFVFEELDHSLMRWSVVRNHDYWRSWPLNWPSFGGSKPAGYVDHFMVSWAWDWTTRKTMFLNGDVDFCAVPRQYVNDVQGRPNIRSIYPLPSLAVDGLLYNFNINMSSPWGLILPAGVFNESGIPTDFFGNLEWGLHVRKALSCAIDYAGYINEAFLGEALHPTTAIIPGLPYYDPTIRGYAYNLTRAIEEFQQVPGLWETGFTIHYVFSIGSLYRPTIADFLKPALESLNPKFHIVKDGVSWSDYLYALHHGTLPVFVLGWTADYPDPHDFAYPFYYSSGYLAQGQAYANPTVDALIEAGIQTPNESERGAIYSQLQQLIIDDCPSVALDQRCGRHFEASWICDWYYNPSYPGIYAANLWKWYYTPHAQQDTVTNVTANLLPYDVNYDGKTDIVDISTAAAGFGEIYGPPISPRWKYRCDFNNDRKIDLKDIALVAKNFGKTSSMWTQS